MCSKKLEDLLEKVRFYLMFNWLNCIEELFSHFYC